MSESEREQGHDEERKRKFEIEKKKALARKKKAIQRMKQRKKELRETGEKKGFCLNRGEKRYKVNHVKAVCSWTWPDPNARERCAICSNEMPGTCIECAANNKPEDSCSLEWGVCNHAFHKHCIDRWLQNRANCPLCNTPYETQMIEGDDNE